MYRRRPGARRPGGNVWDRPVRRMARTPPWTTWESPPPGATSPAGRAAWRAAAASSSSGISGSCWSTPIDPTVARAVHVFLGAALGFALFAPRAITGAPGQRRSLVRLAADPALPADPGALRPRRRRHRDALLHGPEHGGPAGGRLRHPAGAGIRAAHGRAGHADDRRGVHRLLLRRPVPAGHPVPPRHRPRPGAGGAVRQQRAARHHRAGQRHLHHHVRGVRDLPAELQGGGLLQRLRPCPGRAAARRAGQGDGGVRHPVRHHLGLLGRQRRRLGQLHHPDDAPGRLRPRHRRRRRGHQLHGRAAHAAGHGRRRLHHGRGARRRLRRDRAGRGDPGAAVLRRQLRPLRPARAQGGAPRRAAGRAAALGASGAPRLHGGAAAAAGLDAGGGLLAVPRRGLGHRGDARDHGRHRAGAPAGGAGRGPGRPRWAARCSTRRARCTRRCTAACARCCSSSPSAPPPGSSPGRSA